MAAQGPRTIFLLRLLQLNIYQSMVEQLRPAKTTPIQYMVLSILSSRGTWSTAELARRFHIAPQSMNEIVSSLEHGKLIARIKSAAHGRVLNIHLTAAGTRRLERCNRAVDRIERAAFKELSAPELAQFRALLGRALLQYSLPEQRSRATPAASPETSSVSRLGRKSGRAELRIA